MATPKQFSDTDGAAVDPFAVDFFGVAAGVAEDDEAEIEASAPRSRRRQPSKKSDWFKSLPRVSYRQAELSNLVGALPEKLSAEAGGAIAEMLARYTFLPPESVTCTVGGVREIDLAKALEPEEQASRVLLNISCQPENALAVAALPTNFAVTLIERILGAREETSGNFRELSPIETTIVEFLAANVLRVVNELVGEPLLCLQGAGNGREVFEPFERGAEIIFEIEAGRSKGHLVLFASKRFLARLEGARGLLTANPRGKTLAQAEKIVGALDLRLQLGTTSLDGDSLAFLETDDIVLIEQPLIDLLHGKFPERAVIRVGRSGNFRLGGEIETGEALNFKISEIISEEGRRRLTPAKLKMEEAENDVAETETETGERETEPVEERISPSLENVQVALRVEIAGNKISLRELQTLRAGQIIALGVSPNDTVRLVTDGSDEPVAAGELVEIEGQLGVRLTRVFI